MLRQPSSLINIKNGLGNQKDRITNEIWAMIDDITDKNCHITIIYVPGHTGIKWNEAADKIAKESSRLDQRNAPLDIGTVKKAFKREIIKIWRETGDLNEISKSCEWYRETTIDGHKTKNRREEVCISQLRAKSSFQLWGSCWLEAG